MGELARETSEENGGAADVEVSLATVVLASLLDKLLRFRRSPKPNMCSWSAILGSLRDRKSVV